MSIPGPQRGMTAAEAISTTRPSTTYTMHNGWDEGLQNPHPTAHAALHALIGHNLLDEAANQRLDDEHAYDQSEHPSLLGFRHRIHLPSS
jgi:hypothetical protein